MRGRVRRPAATRGDVDGAWLPRGGRALPRSGARRGAARAGARRQARRGEALGWAGLSEARRAREAGWADFGRGPEVRRRPAKEEKAFSFVFSRNF